MASVLEQPVSATDPDLAALLSDQDHMTVADVLAHGISEITMAKAWAKGHIEFGKLKHCVTGRPGILESNPTLILETGIEWSGAKTTSHQRFAALYAGSQKLGEFAKYKKYVSYEEADETKWKTVDIRRDEAAKALVLYVRLTDKGLGESDY